MPYIQIKDYGKAPPDWLNDKLKIIGGEANGEQLGSEIIALKLSEIIFTQAIRLYLTTDGRDRPDLDPMPIWLVTHRELHTSRRIRIVFDVLAECLK